LELVEEFPLITDVDRAVALSMLITPVIRHAISVALGHLADAPDYGSGKSFLEHLASLIATGRRAAVLSAARTEEELEKRLDSALYEGRTFIVIDNNNRTLGGDRIAQMVTETLLGLRPLGKTRNPEIVNQTCLYANGCNIGVRDDLVRRFLRARMDANMEHAETREFKRDPEAMILADRGKYISAILTIVRAYQVAHYPKVEYRDLKFKGWSEKVQRPLIWLGCADPGKSVEKNAEEDEGRQVAAELLMVLSKKYGDNPFTIAAAGAEKEIQTVLTKMFPHKGGFSPDMQHAGTGSVATRGKFAEGAA
jgi:putative DNA primase/helicase